MTTTPIPQMGHKGSERSAHQSTMTPWPMPLKALCSAKASRTDRETETSHQAWAPANLLSQSTCHPGQGHLAASFTV